MATAYKGLVIELGADTSKLKSAMREVNTAAKGTQTELNQIRSALKFDPGNVKLLAQQTAQLGNRVEETKDKLRVLKAQLASMDESKVGTDEWDKLQREIIKTEGQLDSYKRALKQSEQAQKAAQSSLGQLGHKLQDVADDYKEVGDSMKSVGTGMTAGITAPVAAAGTAVMATAVQFDDAFAKMKAACQGNEEQAKKLLEVGRNLYNGGWGESVEQITDALIKTRAVLRDVSDEDLEIVTQSAIMLEDTFGSDMTESVRGINVLMKKFGLSAQEACDLLVAGTQRGLDYTDELGDNLSEYGGRWAEAGMSATPFSASTPFSAKGWKASCNSRSALFARDPKFSDIASAAPDAAPATSAKLSFTPPSASIIPIALSSPSDDHRVEAMAARSVSLVIVCMSPMTALSTSCAVAFPSRNELKTSWVPLENCPMPSSMRPSDSDVRNSFRKSPTLSRL